MALCGLSRGNSVRKCASSARTWLNRRLNSATERMSCESTEGDFILRQVINHGAFGGGKLLRLLAWPILRGVGAMAHLHFHHHPVVPGHGGNRQGNYPVILRAPLAADLIAVTVDISKLL